MKKSKVLCLALAAVFAFSAFPGCKDGSGSGAEAIVVEEQPGLKDEAKADMTYLRAGLDPEKEDDPTNEAIKQFEKKYGVTVNYISASYDTSQSQVLMNASAGTPIDVIFGAISDYPLFALKKLTEPISSYVNVDADYFNKSATAAFFTYNGEIYNIAGRDVSPLVMYYNKAMIADAGLTDPMEMYKNGTWTFDNFRDMCKELTKDTDGDGTTDVYGLSNWYSWAFLGANHTALCKIDSDGKYALNFDDPAVTTALEFVQDAYFTSKWRGLNGDNIFNSFYEGHSAFVNEYAWVETSDIIKAKNEGTFDFEYGVAPMPYGPNNTDKVNVGHASGYGIGNGSASPYHAGQLISMILKSCAMDADEKNKDVPEDHLALYQELSQNVYNDTYYDSAINNGNDLMNLVCGGTNIATALSQVQTIYEDALYDANDSAS